MTDSAAQRRMLGTAAVVTFGVGFLGGIERGEGLPTARFIIGTSMAFTICSIMVDMNLGVGAGFAVLIMVSALLYQGEDALALLSKRSKRPKVKGKSKSKAKSVQPYDTYSPVDRLE